MKRILAVVLCLTVFLSSMVIGVISTAAGSDSAETIGADTTKLPTVATGALTGGTLKATDAGYELTGNMTITTGTELADVQTALNAGKTFDGKGFTITIANNMPLFTELKGGTIKNLAIAGDISVQTVSSSVGTTAADQSAFGAIVVDVCDGEMNIENVLVAAKIVENKAGSIGSAGFISCIGGVAEKQGEDGQIIPPTAATVNFKNCAFTGSIAPKDNTINTRGGGFVAKLQSEGKATFTDCSVTGTLEFVCHAGGFVGDINAGAQVAMDNCYSGATVGSTNILAATGHYGGFVGWMSCNCSGEEGTRLTIKNSKTEPRFVVNNASHYLGGFVGGTNHFNTISIKNSVSNIQSITWAEGAMVHDDRIGGFIASINQATENHDMLVDISDSVNLSNIEVKVVTDNTGYSTGGFIGRVQNPNAGLSVKLTNCVNEGNITVNTYSSSAARHNNAAAFIGFNYSDAKYTLKNCVNYGDVAMYGHNSTAQQQHASAILGYNHTSKTPQLTVTDCANYGDITICTRTLNGYAGAVVANNAGTFSKLQITNFVNAGDISVTAWNGVGHTSTNPTADGIGKDAGTAGTEPSKTVCPTAAGFIAINAKGASGKGTIIENSINFGDVTVVNESVKDATIADTSARAAGIIANSAGKVTLTSVVNAGDVSLTAGANAEDVVNADCITAGFIATAANKSEIALNYCMILGKVTSNSATPILNVAADEKENEEDTTYVLVTEDNCYNLEATLGEFDGPVTAEAVIATILSTLAYENGETVNEALIADYIEFIGVFTVTAEGTADGSDVRFTTTVDKAFYDAIEAIAGDANVAFDGIVTVKKYTEKVGAFTHKALNDYYTANKAALEAKGVTKLYMDADRVEANIVDADLSGDNYVVSIRLKDATANTTYAAKAFIKIGNCYIYSTIPAPAAQ